MQKLSIEEYNLLLSNSSSGSLHAGNAQSDTERAYHQAKQALRDIQSACPGEFFTGPLSLSVEIYGNKRADVDNLFKAVADGVQGVGYKNDKQIREGYVVRYD